jgi:16S rRNA (guanine527-N7)-methyltransferase
VKHDPDTLACVSRETSERLAVYRKLLLRWNGTINLISRNTEADIDARHFADCLQLMPYLPEGAREGIDLGSGAGFPGLVLAIAGGVQFVLVEADRRKAAFLREVIAATGAPASVRAERIEDLDLAPADVITARALAPLDVLLSHTYRLLKPAGIALFLKGAQARDEIDGAKRQWRMRLSVHQSQSSAGGVILEVSELRRASA